MTIDDQQQVFDEQCRRLFSLAYRMLGSGADAEDILQEARIRFAATTDIRNEAAWLTTCVTRLCIDELRSAKRKREVYPGPWLPEPEPITTEIDPSSVSMALLFLLESLSPKERAVFILHEAFDYSHDEIAAAVAISPQASRKQLSRARKHIRSNRPRFAPSADAHGQMLMKFAAAVQKGELEELEMLLAEDARAITDAGGTARAATKVVRSASRVARLFVGLAKKTSEPPVITPVVANGAPALLVALGQRKQLLSVETDGQKIYSVFVVVNEKKLQRLADRTR